MAPAITLGIGSALATEPDTKEQRTTQEQRQMPSQAQKDKGMSTADRAQEQRMSEERAQRNVMTHGTYLSSAPTNGFSSEKLIGAELKSRSDDETIGTISDLVIDENGQIAAVIVEVGGFLGLGEKEVAVNWNSIERRLNDDGDGYNFSVDTSKDAVKDAPEYKPEYKTESRKY
jgi:sporulation protein YlmC with PRC-barrel domain